MEKIDQKINILFLVKSLNVGGTERHILNLVSGLDKDKFYSVICCLSDMGPIGKMISSVSGTRLYHNLLRNKFDVIGLWKLINIIRREEIKIIYTINSPLTQFWGTLLAMLTGVKALITRVCATNTTFHKGRRKIVNIVMLPFADRIIAQAESHREYLAISEGMRREKIEVIYNGVEPEKFEIEIPIAQIRGSLEIPLNVPVVGIVARLAPEKGHDIFLKAAKRVLDEIPDVYFLVTGDGPSRGSIEQLILSLEIGSRVKLLGPRKDIPEILAALDVAVLSSYPVVETFSNAVLEYMAAGKPVVATDVGSTADLVKEGETGFLVPYGNPELLAQGILKLLNAPGLLKQMGKAGRDRVRDMFTLQGMISNYETLFRNLAL